MRKPKSVHCIFRSFWSLNNKHYKPYALNLATRRLSLPAAPHLDLGCPTSREAAPVLIVSWRVRGTQHLDGLRGRWFRQPGRNRRQCYCSRASSFLDIAVDIKVGVATTNQRSQRQTRELQKLLGPLDPCYSPPPQKKNKGPLTTRPSIPEPYAPTLSTRRFMKGIITV